MKIFTQEREDGIAELIEKSNSVAFSVLVEKFSPEITLHAFASKATQELDPELFYLTKSILATSTWNQNDDVFGHLEMWNARNTPVHTFTNVGHDHDEMCGHITDTWVIDSEGNLIADDIAVEDLPEKIHLCDAAVIYKMPRSKSKKAKARAEKLIEEIEAGKKFVSMECVFPNFDYAVISPENKCYIVARNEETSFLTKHLRCYKGEGSYNGYKIGRFLKDMVFSGKGYVDNPANPESIIFDKDTEFAFANSQYQDKWFNVSKLVVPVTTDTKLVFANQSENKTEKVSMADNAELALQTKNKELEIQVADLQKQLSEANSKKFQERIDALAAEVSAKDTEVKTANDKLVEVTASVSELTKTNETIVAENAELKNKIEKAEAEKTRTERISTLVEAGFEREVAEKKVEKFSALSAEQFAEVAETLILAAFPPKDEKKEEKKDAKADDITDVLDDATVNDNGATAGAVGDADEDAEATKLRASVANIFAKSMKIKTDSGEK